MASNERTPKAVLDAPRQTRLAVVQHHGPTRAERRHSRTEAGGPTTNVPKPAQIANKSNGFWVERDKTTRKAERAARKAARRGKRR